MKEILILISIGPVQDYISSARKLRDLWFGSHLLSESGKVVAKSLYEQGCELIFPFIESSADLEENSDLIVPNKILASIKNHSNPNDIIQQARAAWEQSQVQFALTALEKIKSIRKIKIDEDLYHAQIGDSGEFFAAWVELDKNYLEGKNKVEKILAGRKNLRGFSASSWDGTGLLKSSLDGGRESVFRTKKIDEIIGLLKKNEHLDTLGCVKRFYPLASKQSKHFDDLTDIALVPYLECIRSNKTWTELLGKYEEYFIDAGNGLRNRDTREHGSFGLKIQSDLLFVESKDELRDYLGDSSHSAMKILQELTGNANAGKPNKYACIMVGDGDDMGLTLAKIESIEGHQLFSKCLSTFARDVMRLIDESGGSVIYAGGDDVMAYLPLDKAIDHANQIRLLFSAQMNQLFSELKLSGDKPTFSIGLSIAHHSAPISLALDTARRAEKCAKEVAGKNALSIIQSKRSGHDIVISGKWDSVDGVPGIEERFQTMIELYHPKVNALPHTLGYQLRRAEIESGGSQLNEIEMDFASEEGELIPMNAAAVNVLRIFYHKEYSALIIKLLKGRKKIKSLSNELIVARQIADLVHSSQRQNMRGE